MKTLALRLAHALTVRDKSPAELARATGKTESAVSQWLSGETKSMRSDSLMAAVALLGCNAQWLASGKGSNGFQEHDEHSERVSEALTSINAQQPTLGRAIEFLADYLASLEPSDRKRAVRDIADLADEPQAHAKITARIEAMARTGFHQERRKTA